MNRNGFSRYEGLLGKLEFEVFQPRHSTFTVERACVEKVEDGSFVFRDVYSKIMIKVPFSSNAFRYYPFDKSYPALVAPLEVPFT